ncbi:MAG: 3'(2'),5'-bisphosphate nucleotidase [Caulobacterales bacterium 68-7]|nr:3'(2'),5'-bisphosphate nucleotidase CysQ [Caulobacterales bacterium]OJU10564.1 MAG: 3'(2'),5'-bisphosphate nucleotidase [Caulobacterales bacterium 68-7]
MSRADDIGAALAAICEEASSVILPLWRTGAEVFAKADMSPVTEADRRGEVLIAGRLREQFPGVHIVGEEDVAEAGGPELLGDRFFLVDPVDGTKAFVRGDPNFTVNIGLVVDGRPVAGAICAPATGEVWHTHGDGAVRRRFGQTEVESISVRPWPTEPLALVSHTMKPEALERLKADFGVVHATPMDSSIKLVRIAEGAADLYKRTGPTMEWDTCAGQAILEAAGGRFTGLDGGLFAYGKVEEKLLNPGFIARGGA